MLRNCDLVPMPHVLVHALQSPNGVHLQLTGHACELHSRECVIGGQIVRLGDPDTVLLRDWSPVPQVTVQSVHLLQRDSLQFDSQANETQQSCTSDKCGHARPPASITSRATCRVRFLFPMPHILEHGVHGPKAVTTQSTGHSISAQERVCDTPLHPAPP